MPQSTTNIPTIAHNEQSCIDQQVDKLAPYLKQVDDDLPIFDIIIERRSDGHFRSSVAIFLPDITLHARAENLSPETAITDAFAKLAQRVQAHHQDKLHKQATLRRITGRSPTTN